MKLKNDYKTIAKSLINGLNSSFCNLELVNEHIGWHDSVLQLYLN